MNSAFLRAVIAGCTAATALCMGYVPRASAASPAPLPPIKHVWIIEMENTTFDESFGSTSNASSYPYSLRALPSMGATLVQYYATGHNSLDNYVAQVSGQGPTGLPEALDPTTENDCSQYADFVPTAGTDSNGQLLGQGCVYPASVKTLVDQLDPNHDGSRLTWKGYMEDMGRQLPRDYSPTCSHDNTLAAWPNGDLEDTQNTAYSRTDWYASKHDPFMYFHSIVDDPAYCATHVVPLDRMAADMRSTATTANLNWITPNLSNDGHDCQLSCPDGWLQTYLPLILNSQAYRQDGMVMLMFDEADSTASVSADPTAYGACCNEVTPGPNAGYSDADSGTPLSAGGQVGAVIISPFVKPGTVVDPALVSGQANATCLAAVCTGTGYYNHYSALRSLEDLFGITTGGSDGLGHLGYAGSPNPGSFGCEVYTAYAPCVANPATALSPTPFAASPSSGGATGPRPADGTNSFRLPQPEGADLDALACQPGPSLGACVAVGDAGTILTTANGGAAWTPVVSGVPAETLDAVACPDASFCVAVGDGGTIVESQDGGAHWALSTSGTSNHLSGVSCASAANCIAVGDGGTIIASNAGTWSAQSSGVTQPLTSISCIAGSPTCVAGGTWATTGNGSASGNNLLLTSDGGAHWTVGSAPSGAAYGRLAAVSCPTVSTCLGVGTGGFITELASGSWTQRDLPPPVNIQNQPYDAVSCGTPTTCVAVGDRPEEGAQPGYASLSNG
ncbi:MAG: hypothetical protein JOY68_09595, partial [Candidatus Dormibacteraeota bacterium]|nr:hypothetical protein [Candidatus Dormibacteraeota bacterium]